MGGEKTVIGRALLKNKGRNNELIRGFGMIWDDATSGHALDILEQLWPLLREDGTGLFLSHWSGMYWETHANPKITLTLTLALTLGIYWEPHAKSPQNEFISLHEPHKNAQCSVMIRRKLRSFGSPAPEPVSLGIAEVGGFVRALLRFVRPVVLEVSIRARARVRASRLGLRLLG